MKYKVGEKVNYNCGDWLFYGTVTALIENSINPCYRLCVDRMVKKNCRFSITQFEFELEADKEDEREQDSLKYENLKIEYFKKYFGTTVKEVTPEVITPELVSAPISVSIPVSEPVPVPVSVSIPVSEPVPVPVSVSILEPEPEPVSVSIPEPVSASIPVTEPVSEPEPVLEPVLEPVSELVSKPIEPEVKTKIEPKQELIPEPEIVETPEAPKEAKIKQKRGDAWENNFEAFRSGDRSKKTHAWISINRKLYKSGDLSDDKFERLMEINFPFEIQKLKRGPKAGWAKQFELWKKGERNSLQEWRQRSVRQYVAGKLSKDKIEKLKEVGILK